MAPESPSRARRMSTASSALPVPEFVPWRMRVLSPVLYRVASPSAMGKVRCLASERSIVFPWCGRWDEVDAVLSIQLAVQGLEGAGGPDGVGVEVQQPAALGFRLAQQP